MVCISCIVIPLVLFIWHRFLQPFVAKIWGAPAAKAVEDDAKKMASSCPMGSGSAKAAAESGGATSCPVTANGTASKKDD